MLTKINIFQEFVPQIKLLSIKQQYCSLFFYKIIKGNMSAILTNTLKNQKSHNVTFIFSSMKT